MSELTSAAPLAPSGRAARSFRGNLPAAGTACVIAYGVAALLLWQTAKFQQSLHVDGAQQIVALGFEALFAIGALSAPFYGTRSLIHSTHAEQRARRGELHDARIALEDSRDDMWWVAGIGLAVTALAFVLFLLGANDGRVRQVMFDWTFGWRGHNALRDGFWTNIKMFMVAEVFVLVWALIVAIARLLPGRGGRPVRVLAIVYTDLFRGIPAIIVIYVTVFGFGLAGVPIVEHWSADNQRFWLSVLALTLVYGAYVAEVYRAGLDSIHWSQTAAARSLGLSQWQTLRYVVVPQAVRRIVPPLLNDFIGLQKDTALASVVALTEVLNNAQLLKNRYFNLSPVTGAGLCFLVITVPMTRFVDYLLKRDQQRMRAGS